MIFMSVLHLWVWAGFDRGLRLCHSISHIAYPEIQKIQEEIGKAPFIEGPALPFGRLSLVPPWQMFGGGTKILEDLCTEPPTLNSLHRLVSLGAAEDPVLSSIEVEFRNVAFGGLQLPVTMLVRETLEVVIR